MAEGIHESEKDMTDDKGAGMKEQMYSDVMTETQISRMSGYSDGYNAGRKAERERCLRILRSHPEKCEGIVLGDCLETVIELIGGGQDAK